MVIGLSQQYCSLPARNLYDKSRKLDKYNYKRYINVEIDKKQN